MMRKSSPFFHLTENSDLDERAWDLNSHRRVAHVWVWLSWS